VGVPCRRPEPANEKRVGRRQHSWRLTLALSELLAGVKFTQANFPARFSGALPGASVDRAAAVLAM
jgi:hypothetical protein